MKITFNDGYRERTILVNDNCFGIVQHYGSIEMFFDLYADDLGNMCSYFTDDDPRITQCIEKLDFWLYNLGNTPTKRQMVQAIIKVIWHTNKELRDIESQM